MKDISPTEWLTGFVLGAASALPPVRQLKMQGAITSPSGKKYQLVDKLGSSERFTLYQCVLPSGQLGILKIAANSENNPMLDRESFVLKLLREKALEVEGKNKDDKPLNYHYFFPELVESFISEQQNNRRVSILGFPAVIESFGQLTSLSSLWEKERVYVDPRTAAWILGKTLKTLAFVHDQGISNELIAPSNILIEKDWHGLIIFDWTRATINTEMNGITSSQEIARAALAAIQIMNGNLGNGSLPESDQLTDSRFEEFVWRLAQGQISNAAMAKEQFYQMIWEMLPRGFHPFTSFAR
ncbi:MAG: hypothetical protein Q8Q23_02515 [bacterium]|nr:hypothetical protein [bacterium]